jgi:hypothetical protein
MSPIPAKRRDARFSSAASPFALWMIMVGGAWRTRCYGAAILCLGERALMPPIPGPPGHGAALLQLSCASSGVGRCGVDVAARIQPLAAAQARLCRLSGHVAAERRA